jgi:hypothetical protein
MFTADDKEALVRCTIQTNDLGFSINNISLHYTAKECLQPKGRTVTKFKNNMTGKDGDQNFLKRHPQLINGFAANIKKLRSATHATTMTCYINNMREVIEGILQNKYKKLEL